MFKTGPDPVERTPTSRDSCGVDPVPPYAHQGRATDSKFIQPVGAASHEADTHGTYSNATSSKASPSPHTFSHPPPIDERGEFPPRPQREGFMFGRHGLLGVVDVLCVGAGICPHARAGPPQGRSSRRDGDISGTVSSVTYLLHSRYEFMIFCIYVCVRTSVPACVHKAVHEFSHARSYEFIACAHTVS